MISITGSVPVAPNAATGHSGMVYLRAVATPYRHLRVITERLNQHASPETAASILNGLDGRCDVPVRYDV